MDLIAIVLAGKPKKIVIFKPISVLENVEDYCLIMQRNLLGKHMKVFTYVGCEADDIKG